MAERFEAYRTRVLSYLGDEEPIGVQEATPSQLERRLRDVAPGTGESSRCDSRHFFHFRSCSDPIPGQPLPLREERS